MLIYELLIIAFYRLNVKPLRHSSGQKESCFRVVRID